MRQKLAILTLLLLLVPRRPARMHPAIMGGLVFILTSAAFYLFAFGTLLALFGPLGAYGALAGVLLVNYIFYAWVVKKTGAHPVL